MKKRKKNSNLMVIFAARPGKQRSFPARVLRFYHSNFHFVKLCALDAFVEKLAFQFKYITSQGK